MISLSKSCSALVVIITQLLVVTKGAKNDVIVEEDDAGIEDESGEEEDDNDAIFSRMWPIIMTLVTGGILIAIIVITCKRCCRRSKTGQSSSNDNDRSNQQGDTMGSHSFRPPGGVLDDDNIWRIDMPGEGQSILPDVLHMKPPPYCENPPAYDELPLSVLYSAKYDHVDITRGENVYDSSVADLHSPNGCTQMTQPSTSDIPPAYIESESREQTQGESSANLNREHHSGSPPYTVNDVTENNDVIADNVIDANNDLEAPVTHI